MVFIKKGTLIIDTVIIAAAANVFLPAAVFGAYWRCVIILPLFAIINIFPCSKNPALPFRLRVCSGGNYLLVSFALSTVISAVVHAAGFLLFPDLWKSILISAVFAVIAEGAVFWNGIIRVYCTSVQLGIKVRVLGVVFGFVPVANLIMLWKIVKLTSEEVDFEIKKININASREKLEICRTKYPVLLVHGVFFRDFKYLDYWGRIPGELTRNGANIFYGNHDSASSVADSGRELAERIKSIVRETGCGKVNIIAHSKGGLDSRYAIGPLEAASYVASLTTVNTPHRGCLFADYLLEKVPSGVQEKIASVYNAAMRRIGDSNPDFMAAVRDLTAERCGQLNKVMSDDAGVYCQSIGSKLERPKGGKFPLNFTYRLAKYFDGENDGLVSCDSFRWGEKFIMVKPKGKRGISHGDMIDLNRENIPGFDVREFYVKLVSDLKEKGM